MNYSQLDALVARVIYDPKPWFSLTNRLFKGCSFDMLIIDDLYPTKVPMNPETVSNGPITATTQKHYIIRRQYGKLLDRRGYSVANPLDAARFSSQAEAICEGRKITSYPFTIEVLTTKMETPAPSYTLTEAEPFPEGHFYVVKYVSKSGCYTCFARTAVTDRHPGDETDFHRAARFSSYFDAEATRRAWFRYCSSLGESCFQIYRVDPKPAGAPVETVVSVTAQ